MNNSKVLSSEYGAFRYEIQDFFRNKLLRKPSVILDPMAGTAPLIPFVETNGHTAYFNDILPVHFFINNAKTYEVFQHYKQHGYDWYLKQLIDCMAHLKGKMLRMSDSWIDESILQGLIKAWHAAEQYDLNSSILLKASILLCVRPLSSTTKSNNPTWLKFGGMSSGKPLKELANDSLIRFDKYYHYHYGSCQVKRRGQCVITKCNATKIHTTEKADFILTSPPYCNRLDPIVLYGPENYFLSVLGYNSPEEELVSINKVKNYHKLEEDFDYLTTNSKHACRILTRIRKSPEADDPSYYLKYYTRYFASLLVVIKRVMTCLTSTGKMYIVTQDNIHRGILIEIDEVIKEMLGADGWKSRVIKRWERHHLGLRNVSRTHAFVKPKHWEKLMVLTQ
jgi:hypothetical protein